MSNPRPVSGEATLVESVEVPAGESRFINVTKGQILQLVDLYGDQVGDFVAYRTDKPDEYLSPAHTCSCLTKLSPEIGDALYSNHRLPLLRIRPTT